MTRKQLPTGPVRSDFADDPEMRELVELFVADMPERVQQMSRLFAGRQIDELKRLTHQLKGAAGGYGFGMISEAAGELEGSIRSQKQVESLRDQVNDLIELCRRVSA
jgi:HPt (histidine-containing phosphotransfer) domain-containing protein